MSADLDASSRRCLDFPQKSRRVRMSAIGPKRTSLVAPHMSAFEGKADMTVCGSPLSRSLLGVKRTSLFAAHMSAYDPKRTLAQRSRALVPTFAGREYNRLQYGCLSLRANQ